MTNWVQPVTLTGKYVRLEPMTVDHTAALAEMAALAAGPLGRTDDAIAAWEQVFEAQPAHPEAAKALEAMYRRERRWRDLVDLQERRLGFVETVDEAIALRVKLGELHEHELGDVTTAIESYATMNFGLGGPELWRKADILADATLALLAREPSARPGKAWIDEELLRAEGVTDFSKYQCVPGAEPPHFPFKAIPKATKTV